jgi:hypothetical protein
MSQATEGATAGLSFDAITVSGMPDHKRELFNVRPNFLAEASRLLQSRQVYRTRAEMCELYGCLLRASCASKEASLTIDVQIADLRHVALVATIL